MHSKKIKYLSYRFGIYAEYLAIWYLRTKFYKILCHRYKSPVGEIDIIAKKGKVLVFLEIKARKNLDHLDHISKFQQERIIKAAEYFLAVQPKFNGYTIRFDAIFLNKNLLPLHLQNFW